MPGSVNDTAVCPGPDRSRGKCGDLVLAVGAGGGPFTASTLSQVTAGDVTAVQLDGVGHYAALEAPEALSTAILDFLDTVDDAPGSLTA